MGAMDTGVKPQRASQSILNRAPQDQPWSRLLSEIRIPLGWKIGSILAVIGSCFEVVRNGDTWSTTFGVDEVTPMILLLIWLPYLLKILALSGGQLELAGVKAQVNGLYQAGKMDGANEVRDAEDAALLGGQGLEELAQDYHKIRQEPSTTERLLRLQQVTAMMRTVTQRDDIDSTQVKRLFDRGAGYRVAALVASQVLRKADLLDIVLTAIREPLSPFEQYEGLRAARMMLSRLDPSQKADLRETIVSQRAENGSIGKDSERWSLSGKVLAAIDA